MAKMRSPNYPAASLTDSLQRVRSLWAKEKRTPVDSHVAAIAIGYSGLSGPSRTALASMKKYGLVDSDDRTVRVSDLALRVLHPADERDSLSALQEAALRPELFAQLHETHRNASDDALRSFLINKLSFSVVGAKQLVKAFRDAMEVSKLNQPDSFPSEALAAEDKLQMNDNVAIDMRDRHYDLRFGNTVAEIKRLSNRGGPRQTYSWPLASGVSAEVNIIGDELRAQYLRAIRRYLEVAENLIEEDVESARDYRLCVSSDSRDLESQVKALLQAGWNLHGDTTQAGLTYSQALIKHDDPEATLSLPSGSPTA